MSQDYCSRVCRALFPRFHEIYWLCRSFSGTKLDMEKGHISLMPYSIVEQLVARGEVELI